MSEKLILLRYKIVPTGKFQIPYELHGPRGARYGLMRNVHTAEMLFAVNLRTMGVVERLGWFRESDIKARLEKQEHDQWVEHNRMEEQDEMDSFEHFYGDDA